MKRAALTTAFLLAIHAPAHASTKYITLDPSSMFYKMTWEAYDKLGAALGGMSIATGGAVFPNCFREWAQFPIPTPPVFIPPAIEVDYIAPPPCVDCNPPPPCVACNPPPPTNVPEASTWAMMLAGFAALALRKWRLA